MDKYKNFFSCRRSDSFEEQEKYEMKAINFFLLVSYVLGIVLNTSLQYLVLNSFNEVGIEIPFFPMQKQRLKKSKLLDQEATHISKLAARTEAQVSLAGEPRSLAIHQI